MPEIKTYTPAGFKALQDELDYLVNVRVEENKKEISTARAFGDLSENSEYDEAKQEQGKIHARIDELAAEITSDSLYIAFTQAQAEVNALMNEVNEEIKFCITGERPSDCTHDCSTCKGCH